MKTKLEGKREEKDSRDDGLGVGTKAGVRRFAKSQKKVLRKSEGGRQKRPSQGSHCTAWRVRDKQRGREVGTKLSRAKSG